MKDNEALLKKQQAESLIRKMVRVNEQVHKPSPYRGLTGVVVDVRTNVEKTGEVLA